MGHCHAYKFLAGALAVPSSPATSCKFVNKSFFFSCYICCINTRILMHCRHTSVLVTSRPFVTYCANYLSLSVLKCYAHNFCKVHAQVKHCLWMLQFSPAFTKVVLKWSWKWPDQKEYMNISKKERKSILCLSSSWKTSRQIARAKPLTACRLPASFHLLSIL